VSEIAEGLRGERALPARPVGITLDDGSADTYEMQSVELGAHAVHHIGDSKAQLEDAVGAARASEVLEGKGVVPAWAHERLRRR